MRPVIKPLHGPALLLALSAAAAGTAAILLIFDMRQVLLLALLCAAVTGLCFFVLRMLGLLAVRRFSPPAAVKKICTVLLAVLVAWMLVCGAIYAIQDTLFFYPGDDAHSRALLQSNPAFSAVEFTVENGKTYHGMMHYGTNESPAPLVINFGGNGQVSYHTLQSMDKQNRWGYYEGYNYLYMDYDGYGQNEGTPHYQNLYETALAAYDYAVSLPGTDPSRIVTTGFSLGTGPAVYLAAHRPVAGLVLNAPYASGHDLYNGMLPIFIGPMRLLERQRLPSEQYAPAVNCPVLIVASRGDEFVPFSSSERLAALFAGGAERMTLDDVPHNNILDEPGVYDRISAFLREVRAA